MITLTITQADAMWLREQLRMEAQCLNEDFDSLEEDELDHTTRDLDTLERLLKDGAWMDLGNAS